MKCPVHSDIELIENKAADFNYHQCPECNGVWARTRALRELVRKIDPNAEWSVPHFEHIGLSDKDVDTNEAKNCPLDGSPYYEHFFGSVLIDVCPNCDGMWFDAGEVKKIRQELEDGDVPNTMLETILDQIASFFALTYENVKNEVSEAIDKVKN